MKNILMIGLVSLILSSCSKTTSAQTQAYVIDSGHTHISFTVDRFGFAKTLGIFPTSSGEIMIDKKNPQNSFVNAKVQTADLWTGLAARDKVVNGAHWLNTERYSEITFSSTSVALVETNGTHATVTGDLTIWGQTQTAIFDVTLNQIGPDRTAKGKMAAGFSMHSTIKRSNFGHETALKFVGDDVKITIELIAHLKSAP